MTGEREGISAREAGRVCPTQHAPVQFLQKRRPASGMRCASGACAPLPRVVGEVRIQFAERSSVLLLAVYP